MATGGRFSMSAIQSPARNALAGIKVIDVDAHYSEPADLWTARAPRKFKDRVPQIKLLDSGPTWVIDGDISLGCSSAASVIRKDRSKLLPIDMFDYQLADVHPSSYDGKARVQMMDEMGIWAQIIYPDILGFGGRNTTAIDPALRLLSTQIYNDAMAELQAESGGRLFPMALLPWWDVPQSVAEAERAKSMGLRGVNTNPEPHSNGFPDLSEPHWDPLWEVCSALDLSVNFHIGASDDSASWFGTSGWPSQTPERKILLGGAMMFLSNAKPLANIVLSGLLERYPKLKIVSVESGAGWIPFLMQALDYQVGEAGAAAAANLSMKPSEYFKRQIYSCFWFEGEDLGRIVKQIGEDNLMFETDFPHPVCLYPDPVDRVAEAVAGIDPAVQKKILSGNAARLYSIEC